MGQIIVIDGKEIDKKSFHNFFYNPYHLENWGFVKDGLKKKYHDLETKLDNKNEKEGKEIISEFIDELHDKHSQTIELILKKFEEQIVSKSDDILSAMSKTMNYDTSDYTYKISPSFNLGSTYSDSSARLSIVDEIPNINENRIYIGVVLHEMTHSIWERKIFDIYTKLGLKVSGDDENSFKTSHRNENFYLISDVVHNNLKEIVTPIILENKEFENLVVGNDWKRPNPKENFLNISYENKEYDLKDFLNIVYKNIKSQSKDFDEFMKVSTLIMYSIQNELLEKHQIFKNSKLDFWKGWDKSVKELTNNGYRSSITLPEQDNLVKAYLPK